MITSGKITFVKLAKNFRMFLEVPPPQTPNHERNEDNQEISKLLKTLNGEEDERNLDELNVRIQMIIVRHPFERILSAYRDKLERIKGRHYYHRKFGLPIIRKFRFNNNWKKSMSMPLMTMRMSPQQDDGNDLEMCESIISNVIILIHFLFICL